MYFTDLSLPPENQEPLITKAAPDGPLWANGKGEAPHLSGADGHPLA